LTWCRTRQLIPVLSIVALLEGCAEEKADPKYKVDASAASAGDGGAAATGDSGGSATGDGGASAATFKTFDDALDKAIAAYNDSEPGAAAPILGASAVLVHKTKGTLHSKGYGEFAADRLYLIASASKILSVGVLMKLADEGKVDFDTPISEYLTDWDAHKTNVTLAQLFSNSSGLPALSEILAVSSNPTPEALAQYTPHFCQYMGAGTLTDCGKAIYQDENPGNNREPDVEFRYGGSQWQLAGAVAEVVSGKSWAELIDETYVEPCGVPSLGFTNPFGQQGVSPLGYPAFDADKANLPESDNPSIEGGAYVTAPDYAKLLQMQMNGGKCGTKQVLSAEAVERMQTDRVTAYGGTATTGGIDSLFTGYGMGWWVGDEFIADPGAYGAFPWIDDSGEYGAMIIIEVSSGVGGQLAIATKPAVDAIMAKLK